MEKEIVTLIFGIVITCVYFFIVFKKTETTTDFYVSYFEMIDNNPCLSKKEKFELKEKVHEHYKRNH